MTVALMYHALYPGNNPSTIATEDRPYAVSEAAFVEQLNCLNTLRVGLLPEHQLAPYESSPGGCQDGVAEKKSVLLGNTLLPDVVITFDDGHISNVEIALPHLISHGLSAYFFITTGYVNKRQDFCAPSSLRMLADAGMVVGSHGVSHQFFDDLSPAETLSELQSSRTQLSEWCAKPVSCLSFPGGRYREDTLRTARSVGFTQLFGSRFGTIEPKPTLTPHALSRIAIRQGTSIDDFTRIVAHDPRYFRRQRLLGGTKRVTRRQRGKARGFDVRLARMG